MQEITPQELKKKIDDKEDFQLVDVREPYEHEEANIGGDLIPMSSIMQHIDKISKDKPVVVYCRSGARSASVVNTLETKFGFTNLINLKGGIKGWAREIDPSLPIH